MHKFTVTLFLLLPLLSLYSQTTIHVPGDYSTIQAAIDAATNGDIVLVDDGTYIENINYKGKAITVGSQFLVDGDSTHIENTIIDGSQPFHPDSGSVVFFVNGEDASSVLCGFTITGGNGTISAFNDRSAGGVYVELSGATIKNNIIEYNSITHNDYTNGGGIEVVDSDSIIIENNVIRNNTITGNNWSTGGGLTIFDFTNMGYAYVANNVIINNSVTDQNFATGGGMEIEYGSNDIFVIGNFIKDNTCSGGVTYGGGLNLYDCSPNVKNNLIVGNSAADGGGVGFDAIVSASTKSQINNNDRFSNRYNRLNDNQFNNSKFMLSATFENNTIVNNFATVSGGGILVLTSIPELMNCIVWGNTALADSQISGTADVQYSDIEGGFTGTGNIDADPDFVASNEYYVLSSSSPCIDFGNPDPLFNDIEDPQNLGNALLPALGTLINDMGHCGGPASTWHFWAWPMPVESSSLSLSEFALMNNYPNPFNPSTTIKYHIKQLTIVELKVFDILGREIITLVNEEKPAGRYEILFNSANLSSGVYFYRLQAGNFIETKKMVLLK